MGFIRPNDWVHLAPYKDAFHYDNKTNRVTLNPAWKTYEERSAKVADVLQDIRRKKIFKTLNGWRNEVCAMLFTCPRSHRPLWELLKIAAASIQWALIQSGYC